MMPVSLNLWSYSLLVMFPRKQTLSQRLAWRFTRLTVGSTPVKWKGKRQDWAKGEIRLWCRPSGKFWGEGRGLPLGRPFRLSPTGMRVGTEPLCPHGLPWNGRVALLEVALFRLVSAHRGLMFQGCPSSRRGSRLSFIPERGSGQTITSVHHSYLPEKYPDWKNCRLRLRSHRNYRLGRKIKVMIL